MTLRVLARSRIDAAQTRANWRPCLNARFRQSCVHGTVRLPTRSCDITICDFNRLDGSSDSGCRRRCVLTKCDQKLRLWIRHLDYSSGLDIWIRHLDWTCGLDIWFRGQPPCEVKQEVAMPGVRCQGRETSPDDDANSIPFHLRLTFKVVCANKVNSFDWDFLTTRHAKDLCVCRVLYHCSLHQLVVVSL